MDISISLISHWSRYAYWLIISFESIHAAWFFAYHSNCYFLSSCSFLLGGLFLTRILVCSSYVCWNVTLQVLDQYQKLMKLYELLLIPIFLISGRWVWGIRSFLTLNHFLLSPVNIVCIAMAWCYVLQSLYKYNAFGFLNYHPHN